MLYLRESLLHSKKEVDDEREDKDQVPDAANFQNEEQSLTKSFQTNCLEVAFERFYKDNRF